MLSGSGLIYQEDYLSPQKTVGHILLPFISPAANYSTSCVWAHLAFYTTILKYDTFLNSGFIIFPLLSSLAKGSRPKLGKHLSEIFSYSQICSLSCRAVVESHSGKCELHCFLTEDFLLGSQLLLTSCSVKNW